MEDQLEFENLLDNILGKCNLDKVTEEGGGFSDLPNGYYLCELENAALTTSQNSKLPMLAFKYKIVENGKAESVDDDGNFKLIEIPKTINRPINKYYTLHTNDAAKCTEDIEKRIVPDMLKFVNEEGPLFTKECFTNTQLIREDLELLTEIKPYIWIRSNTVVQQDGSKSTFYYLISWARASKLGLTEE